MFEGNFDDTWNGGFLSWQKLGLYLQDKGVEKLKFPKDVNKKKSCSSNPTFLQENNF